ncbi:hypothetical protein BH10BAC3_BH10BAC3_30050 [soil metagenome]
MPADLTSSAPTTQEEKEQSSQDLFLPNEKTTSYQQTMETPESNDMGEQAIIAPFLVADKPYPMSKAGRVIVALCTIWTFIHTYFLLANNTSTEYAKGGFATITRPYEDFIEYYDFSEWFLYVGAAWLIYVLYGILTGRK